MQDSLSRVVRNLFDTLLQLPLSPAPQAAAPEQPRRATVSLAGAFQGQVSLTVPAALARDLARRLLNVEQASAAEGDDALGELANILAGNLKAVLPSPVSLGLPVVEAGAAPPADLAQASFTCRDQPLLVGLSRDE